jgi:hypothetical protein
VVQIHATPARIVGIAVIAQKKAANAGFARTDSVVLEAEGEFRTLNPGAAPELKTIF